MKPFFKEVLLLGGFYYFLSYIIAYFVGENVWIWNVGFITIVLLAVIVLAFKDSFALLRVFWKKFPKLSIYLAAFGFVKYFGIIFGDVPGIVDGHLFATAINADWYKCYYEAYTQVVIVVYWIVFWVALFIATYLAYFPDIKLVKFVEIKVVEKAQKAEGKSAKAEKKPAKKTAPKKAGRKPAKKK